MQVIFQESFAAGHGLPWRQEGEILPNFREIHLANQMAF